MAKRKKIDLDKIPGTLEKIVALMDREVDLLAAKTSLAGDDAKNLIAYSQALTNIYKDYKSEIQAISKDLKTKTKEEILQIVKAEAN